MLQLFLLKKYLLPLHLQLLFLRIPHLSLIIPQLLSTPFSSPAPLILPIFGATIHIPLSFGLREFLEESFVLVGIVVRGHV